MQNDAQDSSVSPEALRRRHESQNPALGQILFVIGLVALVTVLCVAGVSALMNHFRKSRPTVEAAPHVGTVGPGVITAPNEEPLQRFPAPNLQVNPRQNLEAFRAREDEELNTYGWIDRDAGIVRIPIDRAMDLIGQRGLPEHSTSGTPKRGKSRLELIRERSQGK
jgi:hypothetical protein